MPKIPPRDNRRNRSLHTIQGTAEGVTGLLQRISRKAGVVLPSPGSGAAGTSMLERLRSTLPAGLQPHLMEVLEKPGELVLFTDSAAWATRIRLAVGESSEWANVPRITVRLMPRGGFRP